MVFIRSVICSTDRRACWRILWGFTGTRDATRSPRSVVNTFLVPLSFQATGASVAVDVTTCCICNAFALICQANGFSLSAGFHPKMAATRILYTIRSAHRAVFPLPGIFRTVHTADTVCLLVPIHHASAVFTAYHIITSSFASSIIGYFNVHSTFPTSMPLEFTFIVVLNPICPTHWLALYPLAVSTNALASAIFVDTHFSTAADGPLTWVSFTGWGNNWAWTFPAQKTPNSKKCDLILCVACVCIVYCLWQRTTIEWVVLGVDLIKAALDWGSTVSALILFKTHPPRNSSRGAPRYEGACQYKRKWVDHLDILLSRCLF